MTPENELLSRSLNTQIVERVSLMWHCWRDSKASMNIQSDKLGKISDRWRDRSFQLIRGKISEHNHTQNREVWVVRVSLMWLCWWNWKQEWTYNSESWASLPTDDGIVPLNWLLVRSLNKITHKNKEVWVERVSFDVGLLVELKARMNIQVLKMGQNTDRWRDRSTQMIKGKSS